MNSIMKDLRNRLYSLLPVLGFKHLTVGFLRVPRKLGSFVTIHLVALLM